MPQTSAWASLPKGEEHTVFGRENHFDRQPGHPGVDLLILRFGQRTSNHVRKPTRDRSIACQRAVRPS
jgi:hypothetical protein